MKTVKLRTELHKSFPEFFRFIAEHLPQSMAARRWSDGYGVKYLVWSGNVLVSEVWDAAWWSPWKWFSPKLFGSPTRPTIELRHPQYYSDIEDVIRKYESATGKEVEFRYWEAA